MERTTTLSDLLGIEHCKIGFYQELQDKIELLKLSNLELESKRKENQALLDGITDLMVVLSDSLILQQVNHVFQEWYPVIQPLGRPCYTVFRGRSERCDDCPAMKALDLDQVVKDLCMYKVEGEFKHYEVIASPLKANPSGERRVLVFMRDVTLEKNFQAQFYQAEKMATVGVLAAGVAHEINNPLAAIHGFAQGLKRRLNRLEAQVEGELYSDFQEYTETIIKECLRCHDIVRTLLTFSRPTTSNVGYVNLNQCVTDTLFILQHRLKERADLVVQAQLHPNIPLITGDESQLKQVIINLLSNAFDAIAGEGAISISTQVQDEGVELTIADSGCGIPDESKEKLFEPFYTTKPVGQGVGIGLSTCYAIVQQHGGSIRVDSTVGEGASFHVLLPLRTEP